MRKSIIYIDAKTLGAAVVVLQKSLKKADPRLSTYPYVVIDAANQDKLFDALRESQHPIFLSLDPELNRLARNHGCTTLIESFGHINKEDENETIDAIIQALKNNQPVLLALDFDETVIFNYHPYKPRGIPVVNPHAVHFFVKLIARMKRELKADFEEKFQHLFSIHIVTLRVTHAYVQEYSRKYPSDD